jgi:hypothetical protein
VPEVRPVNVNERSVEVHRRPDASGYRQRRVIDRADTLAPQGFPRTAFAVLDMIG